MKLKLVDGGVILIFCSPCTSSSVSHLNFEPKQKLWTQPTTTSTIRYFYEDSRHRTMLVFRLTLLNKSILTHTNTHTNNQGRISLGHLICSLANSTARNISLDKKHLDFDLALDKIKKRIKTLGCLYLLKLEKIK